MTVASALRLRWRTRGAIILVIVLTAMAGAGAAYACDTNFWNVSCEWYSYQEGHTKPQFAPYNGEDVYSTWDGASQIYAIHLRQGGAWVNSIIMTHDFNLVRFVVNIQSTDKMGCFNNYTADVWINCRHYDP
jgi:hypothetical protein